MAIPAIGKINFFIIRFSCNQSNKLLRIHQLCVDISCVLHFFRTCDMFYKSDITFKCAEMIQIRGNGIQHYQLCVTIEDINEN